MFAKAREKARSSSCQSNLKQIGLAIRQYNSDYDERYPQGWQNSNYTWAVTISAYLKSNQVYVCPSSTNTTRAPWLTNAAVPLTSYAYNRQFGIDSGTLNEAALKASSNTIIMFDSGLNGINNAPYADLTGADKSMGWVTSAPNDGSWCWGCVVNAADYNWAAPSPRHMDMTNVLYSDGHVKTQKLDSFWTNNSAWLDPASGG